MLSKENLVAVGFVLYSCLIYWVDGNSFTEKSHSLAVFLFFLPLISGIGWGVGKLWREISDDQ